MKTLFFSLYTLLSAALFASSPPLLYRSIVRIESATQAPSYSEPWKAGNFSGGIGTGFFIGDNLFLTNAHVVSNSKRLLITKHGNARKYPAHILHIAHDCDLALITLDNPKACADMTPLTLGKVPQLESQVRVIGYPVGGNRISVTRGVVSRIDFRPYSHSGSDMHLVIQIDAAINPGNSGGPVLQDNQVVGVAFQGLRNADNTGYMIPVPVIQRFLTDCQDGHYDSYVNLGINTFPLFNPAMRQHFRLQDDDPGILIAAVIPHSCSDGILQEGDLLTHIDHKPIDAAGNIVFEGQSINMNEIVERKFAGDHITVGILRNGKALEKTITLTPFAPAVLYSIAYDKHPRFTSFAGLIFQPLDRNLFASYRFNNERLRWLFGHYIDEEIFTTRKDLVVLTRILSNPINTYAQKYQGAVLHSINGTEVTSLQHAHNLLHPDKTPEFFILRFDGGDTPLIFPGKKSIELSPAIAKRYGLSTTHYLSQPTSLTTPAQ